MVVGYCCEPTGTSLAGLPQEAIKKTAVDSDCGLLMNLSLSSDYSLGIGRLGAILMTRFLASCGGRGLLLLLLLLPG